MGRIGTVLTGNANNQIKQNGENMGTAKVFIAFTVIAIMEIITKFKDKNDERCFEISMSILMAAWILRDGW